MDTAAWTVIVTAIALLAAIGASLSRAAWPAAVRFHGHHLESRPRATLRRELMDATAWTVVGQGKRIA